MQKKNGPSRYVIVPVIMAIMGIAACGGGAGGSVSLSPANQTDENLAAGYTKGVPVLVTEAEIAALPQWQRELLEDPGWQQPYAASGASLADPDYLPRAVGHGPGIRSGTPRSRPQAAGIFPLRAVHFGPDQPRAASAIG